MLDVILLEALPGGLRTILLHLRRRHKHRS
jgi:hypothetical protein